MIADPTDTICAPASPIGGGITLVRISGSRAARIARDLLGRTLIPRQAATAPLRIDGRLIDLVVATLFAGPHSYTGEDLLEISCHASPFIVRTIIEAITLRPGCRLAEPGEFTRRAVMHGKMDLSEAEAVADLIASSTANQHRIAMAQHTGRLSEILDKLRDDLVRFAGLLELELDFSEEDITFADRTELAQALSEIRHKLRALTQSFATAREIQQGIPTAIIGSPNVGKSSLLNALLQHDRAIVSDMPGTTRDTIEERLTLGGMLFRLIDTAGLRRTSDPVEQLGIRRSYEQIASARIILWLIAPDPQLPSWASLREKAAEIAAQPQTAEAALLIILNKEDLLPPHTARAWVEAAREQLLPALQGSFGSVSAHAISATGQSGIDAIERAMQEIGKSGAAAYLPDEEDPVLISNLRHYKALCAAAEAIEKVEAGLQAGLSNDLIAPSLREAIEQIGLITGQSVTSDEVLQYIFSHFCIGK